MNSHLQILEGFIRNIVKLTEEEWQIFISKISMNQFSKNEIIESFNTEVNQLHFVVSGVARHYFIDSMGNEVTIWISEKGGLSSDYAAFTKGSKTVYQIQALTPVTCYSISSININFLYDNYKAWERLGRLINQNYLNDFIDRNNFLITLSAKERYELLMNQKPHLFNLIPLKYLASYLNITIETLSRLRSKKY